MELDAVDEPVEVLLVDVGAACMSIAARRFSWNCSVVHSWRAYPMIAQVLEPLAVLERQQRREQQPGGEVARCAEHDERRLVAHASSVQA